MKLKRLLLLVCLIFAGNNLLVVALVGSRLPDFQKVEKPVDCQGVNLQETGVDQFAWNSKNDGFVFPSAKNDQTSIGLYQINKRQVVYHPLEGDKMVPEAGVSLSPQDRYVAYVAAVVGGPTIAIYDLLEKKSVDLVRLVGETKRLSVFESVRVPIHWLNDTTVVYENAVPDQRYGIAALDVVTGKTVWYLEQAIAPALSANRGQLAYCKKGNKGKYTVHIRDLDSRRDSVKGEVFGFPDQVSFSPKGHLVVGYIEDRVNRVAVFKQKGRLDLQQHLAKPAWVDDNRLLVYQVLSGYRDSLQMYEGLYLYSLTRKTLTVVNYGGTGSYSVSPNGRRVLASSGDTVCLHALSTLGL